MRGKFLKKIISMLLVMSMLMPLTSTAFAAEGMEEGEGPAPYGAEALGIDTDDLTRQLAENLGVAALNHLGGGAVVQTLAGYG
ncbi:MAG TPA: hypothetical protein VFC96_02780, partial [Anaerovoracaceae bacterium]|nr:hypothetical protein [Anaerovoracaceae bacterium]